MKTKIIGLIAASALFAVAPLACQVEQPAAACPLPHTSIFVRYTPDPADKGKECDVLTGEFWSMHKYNVPGEQTNTIAILPEFASAYQGDPRLAEGQTVNAEGDFDYSAGDDGFCEATNLSPIDLNLPEDMAEGLPAAQFKYTITELSLVGTTRVPGTQFRGKVEYSEGACTVRYTITGVAPGVECCVLKPNPNPNWEEDEEPEFICSTNADGTVIGDDSLCNATTDEETGDVLPACNVFGECLNPDFKMKCDPNAWWLKGDTLHQQIYCMPEGDIPSVAADE